MAEDPTIHSSATGITSRRNANEETLDPFFLHHTDTTGQILVTTALTGDNYPTWRRSMKIALSVKNKFGFVDGSIPKPNATDMNRLISWTRNNDIIIAWMLNSVSKEISSSVIYNDSTAAIWKDLEERFQQSNAPRIFEMRRAIMNLVQDQMTVGMYFTKLKILWEELANFRPDCPCSCGGSKDRRISSILCKMSM